MRGIYKIENTINGRVYVGSSKNITRRWWDHKSRLKHGRSSQTRLQNSWNKYGPDAFRFEVIELIPEGCDLIAREQHWIDTLGAYERGLNTLPTARSQGLYKAERIAAAQRGRVLSKETRAKMSAARTGRRHSEATRQLLSKLKTGTKLSQATVDKARATRLAGAGYAWTAEQKAKASATRKGHAVTPETRAKIAAAVILRHIRDREEKAA